MPQLLMVRSTLTALVAGIVLGAVGALVLSTTAAQTVENQTVQQDPDKPETKPKTWAVFEIDDLLKQRAESGRSYLQFFDNDSLNTGIYHLPAGGDDGQSPHRQDELYYVLKGKATLFADGHEQKIKPGSTIFIRREVEHRFHTIEEDLTLLVFFAAAPKE